MSRLEKIVFISLSISLFFSENTGKAFLYSCCLYGIFKQRWFFLFFGITSIFFDIYYSIFVGISFLSLVFVAEIVKKFESVLLNLPIWARLYYLFMIVCGAELVCCLFIILLDGRLHFYAHFLIAIKSIFFCYILESLKEYAKRS